MPDLRAMLAPTRDQGLRNTCVAFATSVLSEARAGDHQSAEFLAWGGWNTDGLSGEGMGTSLESGAIILARFGQPSESTWPYGIIPAPSPPISVFRAARPLRISTWSRSPFDEGCCIRELEGGRPVVVGVALYSNLLTLVPAQPIVEKPGPTDTRLGLHAVSLVGHVGGTTPWVLRNSWGDGWADGGYAYASGATMTFLTREIILFEVR